MRSTIEKKEAIRLKNHDKLMDTLNKATQKPGQPLAPTQASTSLVSDVLQWETSEVNLPKE